MMSKIGVMITSIVAAALAGTAVSKEVRALDSENHISKENAGLAAGLAPDVDSWVKVGEGFYEGYGVDGALAQVYSGPAGMRILLSKRKEELHLARKYSPPQSMGMGEKEGIAHARSESADRIEFLQHEVDELSDFVEKSMSSEKVVQDLAMSASICGHYYYGTSIFEFTSSVPSTAYVTSILYDLGHGPPSSPPPPTSTINSLTRRVDASVRTPWTSKTTNIDWTTDIWPEISASNSRSVGDGLCELETHQQFTYSCAGSPTVTRKYVLRRLQTCQGVLDNDSPNEWITNT